jgi:hypothetical protein
MHVWPSLNDAATATDYLAGEAVTPTRLVRVTFKSVAAAGLPIITRYVLLPATALAIFAGADVFG